MGKTFNSTAPQPGDSNETLLAKLLQKMGGSPKWGDGLTELLKKILSAFTPAPESGESIQFLTGAVAPAAAPDDPDFDARYYNTATGFYYNWNIGTQAWAPVPKVYRALLTQSGTAAPVATVLENTIGAITPTRNAAGSFRLNSSSLFTAGKTWISSVAMDAGTPAFAVLSVSSTSLISLLTNDEAFGSSGADGFSGLAVEILVYP